MWYKGSDLNFSIMGIFIKASVPNYCQAICLKQTTLEEDQKLFFFKFLNFMFMIWDSRQEDWQLFCLSFEHCKSISDLCFYKMKIPVMEKLMNLAL